MIIEFFWAFWTQPWKTQGQKSETVRYYVNIIYSLSFTRASFFHALNSYVTRHGFIQIINDVISNLNLMIIELIFKMS